MEEVTTDDKIERLNRLRKEFWELYHFKGKLNYRLKDRYNLKFFFCRKISWSILHVWDRKRQTEFQIPESLLQTLSEDCTKKMSVLDSSIKRLLQ